MEAEGVRRHRRLDARHDSEPRPEPGGAHPQGATRYDVRMEVPHHLPMPDPLEHLLRRSASLHGAISNALSTTTIANHPRASLAATHADIALEHGSSLLLLVSTGHLSSALALLRVQFDAAVRALWILYGAPDTRIAMIAAAISDGILKEPNNMPGIADMIAQLEQKAPPEVGRSLLVFKEAAWRPLSSFIHGGIYALHERYRQFPPEWATGTLRNSNGLSLMAAMTIVATAGQSVPPGTMRE